MAVEGQLTVLFCIVRGAVFRGLSQFTSKKGNDEVFRQLETVQQKNCESRLEKMYSQLEELEKELDILVLSTEMHK